MTEVAFTVQDGYKFKYPVKASQLVEKGHLVGWNTAGSYAEPAAANMAAQKFIGIAAETRTGGATDGTVEIEVYREPYATVPITGVTAADIGKEVYVTNSYTLTTTAPSSPIIVGVIAQVPKAGQATVQWKYV